jgi:hypothetical protein
MKKMCFRKVYLRGEGCNMKIRKRNISWILFVLILFSAFLFQGCGNAGLDKVNSSNSLIQKNSKENLQTSTPVLEYKEKDSLLYFSNNVSGIKISHSNGGGQNSWNLNKKDIPQFREWVLSLQLEYQSFEKGQSPGDYNGGDVYGFEISGDIPLNFTYVDIGDDNHYIELKGKWYLITNYDGIPDILYND